PLVGDVAAHLRMRWREVTGEHVEPPSASAAQGTVTAQVVRTVPERIYDAVPRGEFRILESYLRAVRSARTLIYLESQFLWSPEVVAVLEDKLRRPPTDEFRVVLLLPSKAKSGEDDTR